MEDINEWVEFLESICDPLPIVLAGGDEMIIEFAKKNIGKKLESKIGGERYSRKFSHRQRQAIRCGR